MSRTIQDWFSLYQESHQNPANVRMHFVCVPLIVFSIAGLLYTIPLPGLSQPWFNACFLVIALTLLFYLKFSLRLFLVMGLYFVSNFLLLWFWSSIHPTSLVPTCVTIFVVAWIGQFIGHKWEGKKPSFFQDLFFLLIGPAWVIQKVFLKFRLSLV